MIIEKFSKDDKAGVVFKDACFSSSRNYNGCHFDALEVFNIDNPPKAFNKSHNRTISLEAEFSSPIKPEINGKLLTFKADIVSYDPYIVENADKVTGFSPELSPTNKPVKNSKEERFYENGNLNWVNTAFLFGEPAGFVGVDNNFTLEKFSLNEDVVILEAEEDIEAFNVTDDLKGTKGYLEDEIKRMSKRLEEVGLAITALTEAGLEFFKKPEVPEDPEANKAEEFDKVLADAEAKTTKKTTEDFSQKDLEKFEVTNPKSSKTVGDQTKNTEKTKQSFGDQTKNTEKTKQSLIKKLY